ncbi:MAG: alpha/beta fold hydrolase [Planctomycetes bacterium]|nr:alpha/beta fold hydrolase [Planctomycetota bacterium]
MLAIGFQRAPDAAVSKPLYKVSPVATLNLKDEKRSKSLEITVIAPAEPLDANAKIPPPYPLVVFSHGMGGSDEAFPLLAEYLAARGFVVIRPTHADSAKYMKDPKELVKNPRAVVKTVDLRGRVQDLVFILDSLDTIEANSGLFGARGGSSKIDRTRIAVAGHSAGAFTAALAAGMEARGLDRTVKSYMEGLKSYIEPRFKAGVIISGQGLTSKALTQDSWKKISVPMLYFTGSLDTTPATDETPEARKDGFKFSRGTAAGGPPAWLVFVEGATHSSFGGKSRALALDAGAKDPTDPQLVSAVTNEVVLEFLNATLRDDAAAKAWMANPDNVKALSEGKATIQSK